MQGVQGCARCARDVQGWQPDVGLEQLVVGQVEEAGRALRGARGAQVLQVRGDVGRVVGVHQGVFLVANVADVHLKGLL